uniref:Serine/threonine-protein phosphatase 2A activator n=1 Tax=Syphacia muris TaxID=451379 RepID=A0A0N5AAL0_9BILA
MSETGCFVVPQKKIATVFDLEKWCHSKASAVHPLGYADYMAMLHELNDSVKGVDSTEDIPISQNVINALEMLNNFQLLILECPPKTMKVPRYGNLAYADWHQRLTEVANDAVSELLPQEKKAAYAELVPYILDSFGNPIRIDYGTGHEAAFLMFVMCLKKLGVFTPDDSKALVLRLFAKYLDLVRTLQTTYHMEPAGSHGNPQLLTPESYLLPEMVEKCAPNNLFFDAVKFILKTKTGPFHEHSYQLWNISAVCTWEKVNSGMFKKYDAEVLKKFPVVQHFLFGSLMSIEPCGDIIDPNLKKANEICRKSDAKAASEKQ